MLNANYHPEAISYSTVSEEIKREFVFYWNNDREDDMIKNYQFMKYFEDVSASVKEDSVFLEILGAFGFKN